MIEISLERTAGQDLPEFKKEMQHAFQCGYEIEFGKCDDVILPEKDIDKSLNADGAEAYVGRINGEMAGGAIVNIDRSTQHNHLDFLFVKVGCQSKGVGQAIWRAIEAKYPETKVWETCTPYFEKRNIHFYVNRCGFHIVEFYNPHHKNPRMNEEPVGGMSDEASSCFIEFEKVMKPETAIERNLTDFTTPPMHIGFMAKKYLELTGMFQDGTLAYVEPGGGGPLTKHTHPHDHLFLVIQGEARIEFEEETVFLKANEIYRVRGNRLHSVWNNGKVTAIMLGVTISANVI